MTITRRPAGEVLTDIAGCRLKPWRSQWRSGMSAGSLYQYHVHGSRPKSSGGSLGYSGYPIHRIGSDSFMNEQCVQYSGNPSRP